MAQLAPNAKNTARIGERLHGRAEGGFTAFTPAPRRLWRTTLSSLH